MVALTKTMQAIRDYQSRAWPPMTMLIRPAKPDTLFVGCIDARIDPKKIGISNALIYRTIAALVPEAGDPQNDMSGALGYAIRARGIRHIVIMGHTRCGGLKACCDHADEAHPAICQHLSSIHEARDGIERATGDNDERIRRLEEESVRESMRHLLTYTVVSDAYNSEDPNKKIDIHGWVIDTVTQDIREHDLTKRDFTGEFSPMHYTPSRGKTPADTIEAVRSFVRWPRDPRDNPLEHKPEMLLIGDLDANYNPSPYYGTALIYRDMMKHDGSINRGKRAALQFAIDVMHETVRDIVIMGHTDNDIIPASTSDQQRHTPKELQHLNEALIKKQYDTLMEEPMVSAAVAMGKIAVHAWLFDSHSKRIRELRDGQFAWMGIAPDATDACAL